ncbi:hypothetical protein DRO59_04385 [Candidatus Bathyarchaeota archaeon]|nr:MAG: hypothetical protein DRO59_04385 [Candidatus Bathyarchaeota archaeon]
MQFLHSGKSKSLGFRLTLEPFCDKTHAHNKITESLPHKPLSERKKGEFAGDIATEYNFWLKTACLT